MRKLILMVMLASAAAIYQPAKAQVSLSLYIGTQPTYVPVYAYKPYYVPTRYVAYPVRKHYVNHNYNTYHNKRVVVYKQPYVQHRVYRTSYAKPVERHYVKQNYYKSVKFNHSRPNHGRRH